MSHRSPHRESCRSSGAGKRVLWILIVGAVAAAAVSLFTDVRSRRVSPPPAPAPMSKMSASQLQRHASDNGIVGGAAAGQQELALRQKTEPGVTVQVNAQIDPAQFETAKPVAPTPPDAMPGKSKPAIKLTRVRSEAPHTNRDKAITDALLVAQRQIVEQLRALDPPVEVVPSLDTVRSEYLRSDAIGIERVTDAQLISQWEAAGLEKDRVYAYVDVEVSEHQVRQLRAGVRQESALWLGGLAFAVVAALFGFLRLDAWTKGYLTGGLAVGFAVALGAAVVLFFSAR